MATSAAPEPAAVPTVAPAAAAAPAPDPAVPTAGATLLAGAAAAPPAVPPEPAPVVYALTLPPDSKLDPAVLERTTALASASKLSPDDAQKWLDLTASEVASHAEKLSKLAVEADLKDRLPGGKTWEAQNDQWKQASLTDPDLGNGNPETLAQKAALARRVIASFGGADAAGIEQFLTDSGLASQPQTMKLLVRIGQSMSEDVLVTAATGVSPEPKDIAERAFPNYTRRADGEYDYTGPNRV